MSQLIFNLSNMKQIQLIFLCFLFSVNLHAQSNYNQELQRAAKELSDKIIAAKKANVAILDFENSNRQVSELGSWLASTFATHLENSNNNSFTVKNRADLEKSLQQVKTENGNIVFDNATIQKLGVASGSDVIIYGEITLMDNEVTVNIRTKNISLNGTIGGTLISFTATPGMVEKYNNYLETTSGIKVTSIQGMTVTTGGSQTASGERITGKSKNTDCKERRTGDYCFKNNTSYKVQIDWRGGYNYTL